jgi:galactokinase/mevalonate kinase-like predicted kinase
MGGKLLGTGGGFLLRYCPEDKRQNVFEKLQSLTHVPFALEAGGTRIVYYER